MGKKKDLVTGLNGVVGSALRPSFEEKYELSSFKLVRTTANFEAYDEKIKKCQGRETFARCSETRLVEYLRNQCGCTPSNFVNLETLKKVRKPQG